MLSPRYLLIAILASLLGGCVFVTHHLSVQPLRVARLPVRVAPDAGPALAFESNGECQECHAEIYAEWQADEHSRAWFNNPLLPQDPKRTECNNCHAPRPVLEVGIATLPEIRGERHEEGVGCLTCHLRGDHVEGPRSDRTGACRPTLNIQFSESEICASCHAPHGSHDQWRGSEWAARGYTCQSCHMPTADAPVVTGGPPRRRRSHRMRTQDDLEFFREAVPVRIRIEAGFVVVSIANTGVGHNVPGEIHNREMFLSTWIVDPRGASLSAHRESFHTVRREQRASGGVTQIEPGETRVFRYPRPTAGRVRVRLGYKRLRHFPDEFATTIHEEEREF